MDNDTATTVITIFFALSTVSFLLLIVGLFRPSWVTRRPSLQTRKGVFLIYGLFVVFFTGGWLFVASIAEPTSDFTTDESFIYYTGAQGANIRECPALSCKVVDTIPPNTKLTFSRNPFDKNPDWAEYVFPDDSVGYVSKIALPENPVSASPPPSVGGSSSVGGITIGPWNNIQTIVGESYEFHFCEPPSAISGATCGSLADTATNPKGGRPPYSFIKKSGFLPPGMTLELNGTLKGAPTQEGTYNFRLCAKDLYGGEGCQNLAVVVKKGETVAPPSESEMPQAKVSIDSAVCKEVGRDGSSEPYIMHYFEISMSGTATGPVDSALYISAAAPYGREEYGAAYGGDNFYFKGLWTGGTRSESGYIVRKTNDSATITWENGGWEYRGQKVGGKIPGKILITAYIDLKLVEQVRVEKEIICSPE